MVDRGEHRRSLLFLEGLINEKGFLLSGYGSPFSLIGAVHLHPLNFKVDNN